MTIHTSIEGVHIKSYQDILTLMNIPEYIELTVYFYLKVGSTFSYKSSITYHVIVFLQFQNFFVILEEHAKWGQGDTLDG